MANKPEGYMNGDLQSATQFSGIGEGSSYGGATFDVGSIEGNGNIQSAGQQGPAPPFSGMGDAGIPLVTAVNVDEGSANVESSVGSPFKP
jgi:hypothetical protein